MLFGGGGDTVVPIDGATPADAMLRCVQQGSYLFGECHLRDVHRAFVEVVPLLQAARPVERYDDYLALQREQVRACNLLVMKRNFWEYDDFRDADLNASFGLQSFLFDTYAWNNRLSFEFQDYAEKHFPIAEHSHLTYFEYCQLLRYFYWGYVGFRVKPALNARTDVLRPEFGVAVPEVAARVPLHLFRVWLQEFRRPLALNRALVVRSGCGLLPMVARQCGVRMVRGVDPDPRAVLSAKQDAARLRFSDISFKVGSFFPDGEGAESESESAASATSPEKLEHSHNPADAKYADLFKKDKYDMAVFAPDASFLQMSRRSSHGVDAYAPSLTGLRGDLDEFFEKAHQHLNERGIAVVLFSNFLQIAYPNEPHPIELEVKANRRWVVLDYYDHRMRASFLHDFSELGARLKVFRALAQDLRAELWVLHRVEAMYKFGWMHGIPGCRPPSDAVGRWRTHAPGQLPGGQGGGGLSLSGQAADAAAKRRARLLKDSIIQDNGDWGAYQERMARAMATADESTGGTPDDDFARAVRMSVDPAYADKLAAEARTAVEAKLERERAFRRRVAVEFGASVSPRDVYDSEQADALLRSPHGERRLTVAAAAPKRGGGGALKKKAKKKAAAAVERSL